jgi:DNA-binding XRE family transcriptional regulator
VKRFSQSKLRRLRERRMTQGEMAEQLHLRQSHYCRLELGKVNGKLPDPRISLVLAICRELRCDVKDLLE